MKQGSPEQRLTAAARHAAVTMDRNNPTRQIIYDLVNAFEKLERTHDLCHISRPVNASPATVPSSCDCPNKLVNVKLCRNHAIDRLTWLGHTITPLAQEITPLQNERDEIREAMARDIKVTVAPPAGMPRDNGPVKAVNPKKQAAIDILNAINASMKK